MNRDPSKRPTILAYFSSQQELGQPYDSVVEAFKSQDAEFAYAIMRNFNTFTCPVVDENKELLGYYKFEEVCEAINKKIDEYNHKVDEYNKKIEDLVDRKKQELEVE